MANINYKKLLKTLTTEQMNEILKKIEDMQAIDTRYKGAYFWTPSAVAAIRHCREKYDEISFKIGDNVFLFEYNYHESSRNCYYSKTITMNKKTITMKSINTLHRYLRKALGITDNEEIIEENVKPIDN